MRDYKKRLLAVSWSLPPILGPRSIQVGRSLHTLTQLGWHVTVLSTDPRSLVPGTQLDEELSARYLPGLEVVRIPASKLTWFYPLLRKMFPGVGPVPDDQLAWSLKVVEFAKKTLSAQYFDALLTFGHPWSDHLAGLAIQKTLDLPWAAHFSDPWMGNPYGIKLGARNHAKMEILERQVVEAADRLLFTNRPTVDFVLNKYPKAIRQKAGVVAHGYDKSLIPQKHHKQGRKKRLRFLHSGNLYGPRSPQGLLDALVILRRNTNYMDKTEVWLQGRAKHARRWQAFVEAHNLKKSVKFLPPVSYLESIQSASAADVLLLIDAPNEDTSVFLPSKLVDYLMFEKPILGLTPEKGVSADLLHALRMPIAAPDDAGTIAKRIRDLVAAWERDGVEVERSFLDVAKIYSVENTTEVLEEELLGMISGADGERRKI